MTLVAGFAVGLQIFAVDGFGQDTGTGGFTYAPRAAKQKSMCELLITDGIFQRSSNVRLTDYGREMLGTVFSGGNDKFIHNPAVTALCAMLSKF